MQSTPTTKLTRNTKTERTDGSGTGDQSKTVLYNCNCHDFDAVIGQVQLAIHCTRATARRYAYIAHTNGNVTVYKGEQEECERVADVLAAIGLIVRVQH